MINDFNRRWCVGVKTNLNITRGITQKTFMYIIVRKSYNFIVNTLAPPPPYPPPAAPLSSDHGQGDDG